MSADKDRERLRFILDGAPASRNDAEFCQRILAMFDAAAKPPAPLPAAVSFLDLGHGRFQCGDETLAGDEKVLWLHQLAGNPGVGLPLSTISTAATASHSARTQLNRAADRIGEHCPALGQALRAGLSIRDGSVFWQRPPGAPAIETRAVSFLSPGDP